MDHHFNTKVAKELGVEAAVILKNFEFWIDKNRANNKHLHDGRYWTYNSIHAFSELFPYISESKIKRTLLILRDKGYIIVSNYNKKQYDRTNWYSLTETYYNSISATCTSPLVQNDPMDKGNMHQPIPDNKPDNKPDKKTVGLHNNILLTQDEIDLIKKEFAKPIIENVLNDLSVYIKQSPNKYKNHFKTMRNWCKRQLKGFNK